MKNCAACSLNMRVAGFFGLTITAISAENAGAAAQAMPAASSIMPILDVMSLSLEHEVNASGIYVHGPLESGLDVDERAIAILRRDAVDLHLEGGGLVE